MNNRLLFYISCFLTLTIHSIKASAPVQDDCFVETNVFSPVDTDKDAIVKLMCSPISFTQPGLRKFLRDAFSREEYAEEFLPHNFCHLLEFLEFGKDSKQNNLYIQSTLRLFGNKIKCCAYVSSDAFASLLERLPDLLEARLVKQPTSLLIEAKNTIKRILYTVFLSKFSYFKQDPEGFFDDLSSEILHNLNGTQFVQQHVENEQLRQQVIRFLELNLSKIIWSPEDQQDVWISVKDIAEKLEMLYTCNIVDQDELDDLYQSLVGRFIQFLDLAGANLSIDTLRIIQEDINASNLLFLTLDEQEEYIPSKVERLQKALEHTQARIIAQQQGIIVS